MTAKIKRQVVLTPETLAMLDELAKFLSRGERPNASRTVRELIREKHQFLFAQSKKRAKSSRSHGTTSARSSSL